MEKTGKSYIMGPIRAVKTLPGRILRVEFDTGGILEISMLKNSSEPRFSPLREESVWENVTTDRQFIYWNREGIAVAELSWQELIRFAIGRQWA